MENKSGGSNGTGAGPQSSAGGREKFEQKDRRAVQLTLRPPSRRIVTRPGGAAASRRQNHQMTMAHLKAATPVTPSRSHNARDHKSEPIAMSVNDFPSLKDASRGGEPDSKPRRGSERRSLLRKSNKYAASVSATASQRMLLARQESAKQAKRRSNRRRSTGESEGFTGSGRFAPAGAVDDFGFDSLKAAEDAKKASDTVLIDEDGFIIGAEPQADPFASSSFNAGFPPTSFKASFDESKVGNNSFFPASSKDTKKKKGGSRRASMTGKVSPGKLKKKDDSRIDAVERATKKKLDMLRRAAEQQGDPSFGNKVDMVEQETMKQIRRIREHYKQGRDD